MSTKFNGLLMADPHIRHGRLCIAGTQTTVHRITVWYKMGMSAEEIAREYPHLPVVGIY